jgi:haloacetate dehalogenase
MEAAMLEGFTRHQVATSGPRINTFVAGDGPPLLMLHGYPQSHIEWRHVAPRLAEHHTVVLTDLRGYGDSDKPASAPDHRPYSKRVMAQDQVEVMASLGFDRFAVVGHDRGGRVAHRMALDHVDRVSALVIQDIAPSRDMYLTADMRFGMVQYHWFFLAQPTDVPEVLLGNVPEYWVRQRLGREGRDFLEEDALREYVRIFSDPASIHATCEDYRAGATIDLEDDGADLDAKVQCPTLVMWGERSFVGTQYDVLDVWSHRVERLEGLALPCGHFLAEERPDETYEGISAFLRRTLG